MPQTKSKTRDLVDSQQELNGLRKDLESILQEKESLLQDNQRISGKLSKLSKENDDFKKQILELERVGFLEGELEPDKEWIKTANVPKDYDYREYTRRAVFYLKLYPHQDEPDGYIGILYHTFSKASVRLHGLDSSAIFGFIQDHLPFTTRTENAETRKNQRAVLKSMEPDKLLQQLTLQQESTIFEDKSNYTLEEKKPIIVNLCLYCPVPENDQHRKSHVRTLSTSCYVHDRDRNPSFIKYDSQALVSGVSVYEQRLNIKPLPSGDYHMDIYIHTPFLAKTEHVARKIRIRNT